MADFFHSVLMSSRFTKKSVVKVSGRLVKTPTSDLPTFVPSARIPPSSTVISGAVRHSWWARSSSSSAGFSLSSLRW